MRTTAEAREDASRSAAGAELERLRSRVDEWLEGFLDGELGSRSGAVSGPIRYSVLGSGKRIRPLLLLTCYRAVGGHDEEGAIGIAAGVELVHAYSLVHDDLPCMDDDVLRRGRPTVHVRFGVPAALYAGAALMPLAVRAVLRGARRLGLGDPASRRLLLCLTRSAGAAGMVGGQLRDLRAEGREVSARELEEIQEGKTARLMGAAAEMGGIAAGAPDGVLRSLHRFGLRIGLAFQAVDDILDLTGSAGELGKTGGRDEELHKATAPSVLGLAAAERRSRELAESAVAELDALAVPPDALVRRVARFAVERER